MLLNLNIAVAYIAKVRILEQITTLMALAYLPNCCCLYRKGKNFRANHNKRQTNLFNRIAVAYIAKVRILEQITTKLRRTIVKPLLLLISQR